ncbi:L-aspartate oxidase [cyanobacterium endosymbiont of Rhopalodia gibberula]|uniref:L-aspartate oxidase n=1 Tax=cyanobacterium endosymbiont of Rhopalodia gibberula TaxID=1763363 RepID=UPI000E64BF5C|nr:L-aspartate oxidase [cyanobacterium endosymbiont of Rhopalodia gibberula]
MTLTSSASFISADPLTTQFDILVVGSGAAGLYGALCLPPKYRVGLITKDTLETGASDWAQGGIAAAIAPNDSPQFHLEDTLKAGVQLCDYGAVEFLVNEAPSAIDSLVKMGVAFDRKNSQLAMTLEAAHSHPRVLHAADTTGRAIVSTLTEKVLERPNITIISQAVALKLWLDSLQKQCLGVSVLYQRQIHWIRSSAVILATGGGGRVYAQTTNPTVSTGDGVALAWRGGAILKDLEFFQFHPTALIKHNAPHFLISEAVRGEGAHLIDHQGRRFAFDYHPNGELAPRDVVSRAIFSHLQRTAVDPAHGYVYLDLRPIESERIRRRFPNIIQVCRNWGIDVFKEPIPVAPAAHYWMGGIRVNLRNETSIKRLYAIGETASTGVHGANRLASNSLLECLVFAAQLSKIEVSSPQTISPNNISVVRKKGEWTAEIELIKNINRNLPILLWKSAGICREQSLLETALDQVKDWREQLTHIDSSQYVLNLEPGQEIIFDSPTAHTHLRTCAETLNLLDIAYLILKSALFRTESRGGHYRIDYPKSSLQWRVHTIICSHQSRTNQVESV